MSRVPIGERMQYSAYADLGWDVQAIARHFKRDWHTVDRWLESDRGSCQDRPRSGRPRVTSPKEDKELVRRYRKDWRRRELGRRSIGQELKKQESNAPVVSGLTVYRRCAEAGGEMRVKKRRFALTDRHKRNRVKFAKDMKGEDFSLWLWSDETTFEIGTRKRKVFHFPGEELEETKYRHPVSQMVWSCVSSAGPGEMVFIDGTLNAEKYKVILSKWLFKASKKLFGTKKWKVTHLLDFSSKFCFLVPIRQRKLSHRKVD